MKCRKCGAVLLDTDTFCVKCGQKVGGPIFCSSCGVQLRDEERFCHKCGAPVEEDEIPLSEQRTVDIPFDLIEQGILLEAKQAIVKRPEAERHDRRSAEGYGRPGAEMAAGSGQSRGEPRSYSYPGTEIPPVRNEKAPSRYEEDYGEYEEYDEDEEDDEDSGGAGMKAVTIILGIIVVAVMLTVGFILWQRNASSRYERPEEETEQGEDGSEDNQGGDNGDDGKETRGRIQILSNVNVRNKPTTEGSEVLMVAKEGETYEYYELVDEAWYHIRLEDGGEGYVSEKYVEDLQ